ncbi:MAG: M15 family metallopeptidase [Parcubacteria group bacterium]|nr:M15 family metallopeptidase [Parcubacteria group bacterium]
MSSSFAKARIAIIFLAVLAAALFYGGYRYRSATLELRAVKTDLLNTVASFEKKVNGLEEEKMFIENARKTLESDLVQARAENMELSAVLAEERNKNSLFESQIKAIGGTVGTLEKLSKTDKELLRKYSKVYFLSENYKPSGLSDIASTTLYETTKAIQIHTKVLPFLTALLEAAKMNGTPLEIISAYRSFGEQAALKSGYTVTYGSGANKFSADQGYSEHQLGTTLDFTTPDLGSAFIKFERSGAYAWLTENAHLYGFVLSYPKDNAYYQFEPWHWRFVGVALATKMHNSRQYFYDLDQREIDSYLISFFD